MWGVGQLSGTAPDLILLKGKQPRLRPVPVVCVLGREGRARGRGFPSRGWVKRPGDWIPEPRGRAGGNLSPSTLPPMQNFPLWERGALAGTDH